MQVSAGVDEGYLDGLAHSVRSRHSAIVKIAADVPNGARGERGKRAVLRRRSVGFSCLLTSVSKDSLGDPVVSPAEGGSKTYTRGVLRQNLRARK